MNALLAGFFELMALFSAILSFFSSIDIIVMFYGVSCCKGTIKS